jgi:exodeoxyribonuclease VII small subunit
MPDKPEQENLTQPFTPVEQLSYEQAILELEEIVSQLESNEKSLEQLLHFFERGQVLAKYCTELLEQAEVKVQQITGDTLVDL